MCLYPKLLPNRKYRVTKKNGGNVPPLTDQRLAYVPVGCQKCSECREQKARGWKIRLKEELRHDNRGKFVTLTFSTEALAKLAEIIKKEEPETDGYDLDNAIATLAMRRFLERWRKKYKVSVKHWCVTELGQKGRYEHLHIHGIIFTNESKETIESIWKYGSIWVGKFVNDTTIGYIVKYMSKPDELHKHYTPKMLCSAGIGRGWMNRNDKKHAEYVEGKEAGWIGNKLIMKVETKQEYRDLTGKRTRLPIYYRNKIYTEEQREKLWIEMLNKQERYVKGERVWVGDSKGEEEYHKLVEWHRAIDRRRGYGGYDEGWEKKEYERTRRNMLMKNRLKKLHEWVD